MTNADPLAIAGYALRFPGADDAASFWRLMMEGRNAISAMSSDRVPLWMRHEGSDVPGRVARLRAGLLADIEGFDAEFFSISPRQAEQLDPQQRQLLMVSVEALTHAGLPLAEIAGKEIGVFVGYSNASHVYELDPTKIDTLTGTSADASALANRISHTLDLRGPSIPSATACSSSLTTLYQAANAIRQGDIDVALVCGVNLITSPASNLMLEKAGLLSPDGLCKAFDHSADGYVRSEGVAAMVLMSEAMARQCRAPLRARLVGSGSNASGRTPGMSQPSSSAQAALMRKTQDSFDLDPRRITYAEAHATGTSVGDPIECEALGQAIGQAEARTAPLLLGSVKSNIGHMEAASGLGGLIKCLLILQHRTIPPSINIDCLNGDIDFEGLNLEVVREARSLPQVGELPPLVAVNSFGFGGANAHAVLEAAPEAGEIRPSEEVSPIVLPVSAKSPASLEEMLRRTRDYLDEHPEVPAADLMHTAFHRRDIFEHRAVVVASERSGLLSGLEELQAGDDEAGIASTTQYSLARGQKQVEGKLAFVFSGNGPQWFAMGRELLEQAPLFRERLETIDRLFRSHPEGFPLIEALLESEETSRMAMTQVAQPALFALQLGLVEELGQRGLKPSGVVGHSVGEIAAAVVSGGLTLEQGVRVVLERSRLQELTAGKGGMAALGLPLDRAISWLGAEAAYLVVAAENSPEGVTLSGATEALERLQARAEKEEIFFRLLPLNYAFHSPEMDEIEAPLLEALEGLAPQSARVPFFSTVTGGLFDTADLDSLYWWRNIRAPVAFRPAIAEMAEQGFDLLIEVGPNPALTRYVEQCYRHADRRVVVLPSLQRKTPEVPAVNRVAAEALVAGARLDFGDRLERQGRLVDLPLYAWNLTPYRYVKKDRIADPDHPLLGSRIAPGLDCWETQLSLQSHPYLSDHRVFGHTLFPAAGYIEMARALGQLVFGKDDCEIINVHIRRGLVLSEDKIYCLRTEYDQDLGFRILSRPHLDEAAPWTVHTTGQILDSRQDLAVEPPSLDQRDVYEHEAFYEFTGGQGFDYGPAFRRARRAVMDGAWKSMDIDPSTVEEPLPASREGYGFHPTTLDAGFQLPLLVLSHPERQGRRYIPRKIARVRFAADRGAIVRAIAVEREVSPFEIKQDIYFLDEAGRVVVNCVGYAIIRDRQATKKDARSDGFRYVWECLRRFDPLPDREASDIVAPHSRRADPAAVDRAAESAFQDYLAALAGRVIAGLDAEGTEGDAQQVPSVYRALTERLRSAAGAADPNEETAFQRALDRSPASQSELELAGAMARKLTELLARKTDYFSLWESDALRGKLSAALACGRHHRRVAEAMASALQRYLAMLPAARPIRVLDISASRSCLSRRLPGLLAGRAIDYCVTEEHRPDAIESGIEKVCRKVECVELDPASTTDFDLLDGRFDIILANDRIQETPDFEALLEEIHYRLEPGGLFLASLHHPSLFADLVFAASPNYWDLYDGRSEAWQEREAIERKFTDLDWTPAVGEIEGSLLPVSLLAAIGDPVPAEDEPIESEAEDSKEPKATDRHLLLLGFDASDPLWTVLQEGAREAGAEVHGRLLELDDPLDAGRLADLDLAAEAQVECVVLTPLGDGTAFAADVCVQLAEMIKKAEQLSLSLRITLLTRGLFGDPDGAGGEVDPSQAVAWGFARTLSNEMPNHPCRRVDLPKSPEALRPRMDDLMALILDETLDDEFLITAQALYRQRLRGVTDRSQLPEVQEAERYGAGLSTQASLAGLRWYPFEARTLGAGEVEIAVEAVGLNYKDVLLALGALPATLIRSGPVGPAIGIECAGRVLAVGGDVEGIVAGDRVMALCSAALSTTCYVDQHAVVKVPEALDSLAAASLPTVFATAWYGLMHLARLEAGESLLVHGGAGGVGQAAIQIAKLKGARVFATAGSPERREFLERQGVDGVFPSRDLSFFDAVMDASGGGVDVVLNSLAGEGMRTTLRLLKPFGRFVEIGKRDFVQNTALGMGHLIDNVSYFAVDLEQMITHRPKAIRGLLREVAGAFETGALRPPPLHAYAATEVQRAYEALRRSEHIGKIVVDMKGDRPSLSAAAPDRQIAFRADRTYLVTGGTRGFGLRVAQWLLERGAKNLFLLSRSGRIGDDESAFEERANANGARVVTAAVDVGSESELREALDSLASRGLPPLAGVFHAAVAYRDRTILQLDPEDHRDVLHAKAEGACLLDRLTADQPLEQFVLFSSIATVIGSAGQASYVASNFYLEALAEQRRRQGRPSLCVNLPPIEDTGILTSAVAVRDAITRSEMRLVPSQDILYRIEQGLLLGLHQVGIGSPSTSSIRQFRKASGHQRFDSYMDDVGADLAEAAAEEVAWHQHDDEEGRRASFEKQVLAAIGEVLHVQPGRIQADQTLLDLGVDSLLALQITQGLERTLGVRPTGTTPVHSQSVCHLIEDLYQQASGSDHAETGQDRAPTNDQAEADRGDVPATWEQIRYLSDQNPTSLVLRIHGPLDLDALEKSIDHLVARHDIFRTSFEMRSDRLYQVVRDTATDGVVREDYSYGSEQALMADLAERLNEPFDLTRGPFFRANFLIVDEREKIVFINAHHSILDGWCVGLLQRELIKSYATLALGLSLDSDSPVRQYREYALEQDRYLGSPEREADRLYWQGLLGSDPVVASLSRAGRAPMRTGYPGAFLAFESRADLVSDLRAVTQEHRSTLAVLLNVALALLIHDRNGDRDFVTTTLVTGRDNPDWAEVVGPTANRVPLLHHIDPEESFASLLKRSTESYFTGLTHARLPGELIAKDCLLDTEEAESMQLFSRVCCALHTHAGDGFDGLMFDFDIEQIALRSDYSYYEVSWNIFETKDKGLNGYFEYATELFSVADMEEIRSDLLDLLESIASDSSLKISQLKLPSPVYA